MSIEREIIKRIDESKNYNNTVYTIECSDPEHTLEKILNAIKVLGDIGHSCDIIIDPGTDEEVKLFYDGDGSDRIYEIK